MSKVKIVCDSCAGTGIYQGFMEKKNEAVICLHCSGDGYVEEEPFTKLRIRRISKQTKIRYRSSTSVAIAGHSNNFITYAGFLKGKRPGGK